MRKVIKRADANENAAIDKDEFRAYFESTARGNSSQQSVCYVMMSVAAYKRYQKQRAQEFKQMHRTS